MRRLSMTLILLFSLLLGQVDSLEFLHYVPFQIGNRWQYEGHEFYSDSSWSTGFVESQVIGDTTMPNGLKYYIIDHIPLFGETFARIDSVNQILYYYNELYGNDGCNNNEWDFLNYSFLDSAYWNDCANNLADLHTTELFIESLNDTFPSILVEHWGSETQTILSMNLGISSINYSLANFGIHYKLIAATINGIQYGEYMSTSTSNFLPQEIVLHQNYPNPFNPETTIAFELPKRSKVRIVIYDILGREVVRLVEDQLNGGAHKTIWRGKDQQNQLVSSGVYIYTLSVSSMESKKVFSKNGKMVLMK
ncbi:MAG: T9SS type A sorting domain-containing protein [Candidatus Marinimicrobia bacterium]|nr:T9SS type A sorting domain-containing protein [Candidatus Neomarinimicrobiota bacterium]